MRITDMPDLTNRELRNTRLEQLAQYTLNERRKVYNDWVRRMTNPRGTLRSCA